MAALREHRRCARGVKQQMQTTTSVRVTSCSVDTSEIMISATILTSFDMLALEAKWPLGARLMVCLCEGSGQTRRIGHLGYASPMRRLVNVSRCSVSSQFRRFLLDRDQLLEDSLPLCEINPTVYFF